MNDTMRNINSKLETLFARGGATGGARIAAGQSMARLTTVLFALLSGLFILTGMWLGFFDNCCAYGQSALQFKAGSNKMLS